MTDPTPPHPSPPSASLREGYSAAPDTFDEMLEGHGLPRAPWRTFLASLEAMSPAALERRWGQAGRMIRENGVTYNVYGDPRGADRPWALDPIPMLFSAQEWARIEEGLRQRALLLDQVLADIYGPQKLLADGLLPADLILAHPGFLRPCHGMSVPENRYLHLYAADLGRAAAGQLCVVGDRTQAPSGGGYALENRLILQRTLPDVFRDCRVQRLARFYLRLREVLAGLAPHNRDHPRIIVLTPGPLNETYFEHAYLARYLGYTLAEGGDLTVRDRCVYLKTLGGLQQVDVILRRVDDDYCDPLELRGSSFLGVAGLLEAARAGNVAVANALGTGLLETPAIMPFLPALCRRLLGEELRLPSVETWWCGDATGLQHVLANLDRLEVRPAFPAAGAIPGAAAGSDSGAPGQEGTSAAERAALVERIKARPHEFVGQERLSLSTSPVLVGRRLEPRRVLVRAFVLATEGGPVVMPGGLTRVAAAADSNVISLQRGAGSKDTWVLATGPADHFSLLDTHAPALEMMRGRGLPSRAADNLFWLGRYLERTEGMVRLLRGLLTRLIEQGGPGLAVIPNTTTPGAPGAGAASELPRLLHALTHLGKAAAASAPAPVSPPLDIEAQLRTLVFDAQLSESLLGVLRSVHRTAALVRDRLSADAWRILFNLQEGFRVPLDAGRPGDAAPPLDLNEVLDLAHQIIITLAAFGGLASESMTRGQGWRFLDMGRRLERAQQTASLLGDTLVRPAEPEGPVLEALLEVADSIMTYRRRYLSGMRGPAVLELVLTDEANPRSVAFQLSALAEHVNHLPVPETLTGLRPEQRIILRLLSDVRLAEPERLCQVAADGSRKDLVGLMERIATELPALSDALASRYLSHIALSQQMSSSNDAGGGAGDGGVV